MHKGDALPLVREDELMPRPLVTMTAKSFGCLGIIDKKGRLIGVITDGDLRRHMGADTAQGAHRRYHDAQAENDGAEHAGLRRARNAECLAHHRAVRGRKGKPVGIIHVHDLLRAGRRA